MKRIAIILLSTLLFAACEAETKISESEDIERKSTKSIETDTEDVEDTRLQFGEFAEIDGIKFTVNNAEFTKKRIPDYFETFEYVVKLDVTYKNTTDYPFHAGRDVVLVVNGKDATYYDMEGTLLEDVNPHDSINGSLYYAFNGQPKELTARFQPLLNTEGQIAEFNVTPR